MVPSPPEVFLIPEVEEVELLTVVDDFDLLVGSNFHLLIFVLFI